MYQFNFLSIFNLIVGSWILFTGVFLFFIRRHTYIHLTYFSTAAWILGYAFAHSSVDQGVALFWCKFVYAAVLFIAPTMYHFVVVFWKFKKQKVYIWINYIISIGFLGMLFVTPYLIKGVRKFSWGYHTIASPPLQLIFLLFFSLVYGVGLLNLYRRYKQQKQEGFIAEALRTRYFLLIYLICVMGAMDFLQDYGLVNFYPVGFFFPGIGVTIAAYAIIRYRLMDIKIAVTRAGVFTVVYSLVLGLPFYAGWIIKSNFSQNMSKWWFAPIFLMAVLASAGPFIYIKLQKRIENKLRAEEFKAHRQLRGLSRNMLRFTKMEDLLKLIVHYLVKVLRLKFTAVYLIDSQSGNYILKGFWQVEGDEGLPSEFSKDSRLIKDLDLRRLPIVTEELKLVDTKSPSPHLKEVLNILNRLKANIIIPSFLRNDLLGFFVLSDRRIKLGFTQEDLNLLMVLSNEAALAIENAQFHQKERSALAERSRREALADMAPGAGHQFNNRLAVISGKAELTSMKIEAIDIEGIEDKEIKTILKDTKEALDCITEEAMKGKEITDAILHRAKAKVEKQAIDIRKVIETAYKLVEISHPMSGIVKRKGIEFSINERGSIGKINGSEALLQDSFYNILDNAVDAIEERMEKEPELKGKIMINLERQSEKIKIEIIDNGIGLNEKDKDRIFTPYFTTKGTSEKGTGLGLYMIREFIEDHKGSIICESEYGKGTRFTIKIGVG